MTSVFALWKNDGVDFPEDFDLKGMKALFQSIDEAFNYLNTKKNQMKFGLERMEWMLARLDHPERRLKFIHIAGTNGKGSTAAMIASVLAEAGYDTGLYASPYITKWNDEIQVNGQPISDESFLHWLNHLLPFVQEMEEQGLEPPSYYELKTLIAICYFAHEVYPDFVVWETLLGGRLDATNVVYPIVSVITQIGKDHQELLGDTIAEITKEKAAIIKPGVPVVSSARDPEAQQVIKQEAAQKKAALYQIDQDFQVQLKQRSRTIQEFDFSNVFRSIPNLSIRLLGQHQLDNAATAVMTLEVLRQFYAALIEDDQLYQGLVKTTWPGRFELVNDKPLILLDVAHNLDGVKMLSATLKELYTYDRLILLTAMMRDKEVELMLRELLPLADEVVATQVADQERSLSAEEISQKVKELQPQKKVQHFSKAAEAVQYATSIQKEGDLLLITGSLYLIAEIRHFFVK